MSTDTNKEQAPEEISDQISDLLEERKGERRQEAKAPTYLNPALDRRRNDRRDEIYQG